MIKAVNLLCNDSINPIGIDDLSPCFWLEFYECDLSQFDNNKLREGCVVKFYSSYNFSDNLDLSRCSKIDFENCDISNLDEVRIFEKGKF